MDRHFKSAPKPGHRPPLLGAAKQSVDEFVALFAGANAAALPLPRFLRTWAKSDDLNRLDVLRRQWNWSLCRFAVTPAADGRQTLNLHCEWMKPSRDAPSISTKCDYSLVVADNKNGAWEPAGPRSSLGFASFVSHTKCVHLEAVQAEPSAERKPPRQVNPASSSAPACPADAAEIQVVSGAHSTTAAAIVWEGLTHAPASPTTPPRLWPDGSSQPVFR